MSITTIADPTVRLVASQKLRKFVGTLKPNDEMPKNIAEIYAAQTGRACSKILTDFDENGVENIKYTEEEEKFLAALEVDKSTETKFNKLINNPDESDAEGEEKPPAAKESSGTKAKKKTHMITLKDVKWLDSILKKKRENGETKLYLHELLDSCDLILPENEVLERNPELEARCKKLRQQQEEYLYHKMTRNVDNSFKDDPQDTISFQMKQMNRQLIAVAQFIFSVLAGFAFGFIGIELIIGDLDFGFRLLLGIIIALVIALAEIYFLAKRLNEDTVDKELEMRTMKTPTALANESPKRVAGGGGGGKVKPHQE